MHALKAVFLPCAILFLLLFSGCDLLGTIQNATDEVAKTNNILTNAINALANQSADWQSILQSTEAQLTDSAQSTIKTEVSNTLNRAIQAAGSQIKCIVDFMHSRVQEDLIRIRAGLLKQPVPPVTPVFCTVVPAAIDLSLDITRRNLITIDGYNFDTTPTLQAALVNGSQSIDETSNIHLTTFYQLTINTGSNGIPISSTSQKILLKWNDQVLSDIPVIQSIPTCRTQIVNPTPQQITVIPPMSKGDGDFHGNGPHVTVAIYPSYSYAKVLVVVDASFVETDSNHSTVADGCASDTHCIYTIYTPPPGWKIQTVSNSVTTNWDYVHSPAGSNHQDAFYPGAGYVSELLFSGFEGSHAAGTTAQMGILFNQLTIQIVQTTNCQ